MKPLHRWQEALVVLVLTALATLAPTESAFADVARARKLAATAMTHFQQKKYMAAVRFHGQAIGALPTDKAHQQRAESLFYIGLCYHRLKYRSHAVGAWKRFLVEIKNVPGANNDTSWRPRIRLAKAVVAGGAAAAPRDPDPDPSDPPPAVRKPPTAREVEPPPGQRSALHQRPTPSRDWLGEVRRCLRKRPKNTKAAVRRLHYCRSQMPKGAACKSRCRVLKKRILKKAEQLEQRLPPSDDPRDRWHGQPPPKGGGNTQPPRGNPGDDPGGQPAAPPRPRPMSLKTIGTITTAISVGVGLLGLGLYFVGKGAIEDRDDLLRGAASPENTSAIVAKHSQAESMYMGAWISLSVAGVGMSLGAILFSIGRRTDHLNYNAKAPAPRRSRRVTLLSTGVFP